MARLKQAKSPDEVKRLGVGAVRQAYNDIAEDYNRIIDGDVLLCPKCREFLKAETSFYFDKTYATNRFPICKRCLLAIVEQREKKTDEPNETKESVQYVLHMMNKPYIDNFYEDCIKGARDNVKERNRTSPFATYITAIQSLPNWKGLTWKDSELGDEGDSTAKKRLPRKEIQKIFGSGFSNEDYLYLQDQYDDWRSRTQVDSKSQETYIVRICFKLLDIWKAQRAGKDTKALDTTLNDLMNAANLQPKQNVSNAATDSLTFGQLIEKWENEKPIPEPDDDFKDVNSIGKLLRVYFSGHLAKSLGLKNAYSKEYEEEIEKYTVTKPEFEDEGNSSEIYEHLFGSEGGE